MSHIGTEGGFGSLPRELAATAIAKDTEVTALIYEFKGQGYGAAVQPVSPGRFAARDHLVKSGIWSVLEAR